MSFTKKQNLFFSLGFLLAVVSACSSDDGQDDNRLREAQDQSGTNTQHKSSDATDTAVDDPVARRTPIATNPFGSSTCMTDMRPDTPYQRAQSPHEPISPNCSAELSLTVAAAEDGPHYYLKGRIDESCLTSSHAGQLLIKTNFDLPLKGMWNCIKTTAPYSVMCGISQAQSSAQNGYIAIEVLPDPRVSYRVSARFDVIP